MNTSIFTNTITAFGFSVLLLGCMADMPMDGDEFETEAAYRSEEVLSDEQRAEPIVDGDPAYKTDISTCTSDCLDNNRIYKDFFCNPWSIGWEENWQGVATPTECVEIMENRCIDRCDPDHAIYD